jgi:hypothetical protein
MNKKRILDLAEQAQKYADDNFRGEPTYSEAYDMKFAELIILECAGLTLDHKNDDYYSGWCDHAGVILEHFGIADA